MLSDERKLGYIDIHLRHRKQFYNIYIKLAGTRSCPSKRLTRELLGIYQDSCYVQPQVGHPPPPPMLVHELHLDLRVKFGNDPMRNDDVASRQINMYSIVTLA